MKYLINIVNPFLYYLFLCTPTSGIDTSPFLPIPFFTLFIILGQLKPPMAVRTSQIHPRLPPQIAMRLNPDLVDVVLVRERIRTVFKESVQEQHNIMIITTLMADKGHDGTHTHTHAIFIDSKQHEIGWIGNTSFA